MAVLNFKCKKCKKAFDFETGSITYGDMLGFENNPECPDCGKLELNELELTEYGQTLAEGEIRIHNGDSSSFWAKKVSKSRIRRDKR